MNLIFLHFGVKQTNLSNKLAVLFSIPFTRLLHFVVASPFFFSSLPFLLFFETFVGYLNVNSTTGEKCILTIKRQRDGDEKDGQDTERMIARVTPMWMAFGYARMRKCVEHFCPFRWHIYTFSNCQTVKIIRPNKIIVSHSLSLRLSSSLGSYAAIGEDNSVVLKTIEIGLCEWAFGSWRMLMRIQNTLDSLARSLALLSLGYLQ